MYLIWIYKFQRVVGELSLELQALHFVHLELVIMVVMMARLLLNVVQVDILHVLQKPVLRVLNVRAEFSDFLTW
ncbi:hypothetical protein BAU24_12650 [Bacillus sp. L27]|nr:hypothetical protein BAU24_12650 [Bacillus sp. L27]